MKKGPKNWFKVEIKSCIIIICILVSPLFFIPNEAKASEYTLRDPIEIIGNSEFTSGNGVVSGTGYASDPYVIEGWEIDSDRTSGIKIIGTTSHFKIRNCHIFGGIIGSVETGIELVGVQNGTIESCVIEDVYPYGIHINGWQAVNKNIKIKNCEIKSIGLSGIYIVSGGILSGIANNNNITISGNYIGHCGVLATNSGYYWDAHDGITIVSLGEGHAASAIGNNIDIDIFNNTIGFNLNNGIKLETTESGKKGEAIIKNINISKNIIGYNTNNGIEFKSQESPDAKMINNIIYNNNINSNGVNGDGRGVFFSGANYNYIYRNNFINNSNQAYDNKDTNDWYYGTIGNYWDDYLGEDANYDGIGDIPYLIPGGTNADNFPLMEQIDSIPINSKPQSNIVDILPNPVEVEETISFHGQSQDSDGFIAIYNWSSDIDGLLSEEESFTSSTLSSGTHTITFKVQDICGEWSLPTTKILTVNPHPNQKPEVEIGYPYSGQTISSAVYISGSASDSDGTINKVEIRIDSSSWIMTTGTESWTYTLDTTSIENGEHTISARSYDGEDYSDSQSVNILVSNIEPENINPTVSIIDPYNNENIIGTVIVTGTASDSDGTINKVEIRIDSSEWITTTGTESWTYTLDSTLLNDGEHTISARSYNGSSYSSIVVINIVIDNIPNLKPTVEFLSHDENEEVYGTITLSGNAFDSDGTIDKVEIRIDNKQWEYANGAGSWTYELDTQPLGNGKHFIYLRSWDGDEYSEIETITINVNNMNNESPGFEIFSLFILIGVIIIWKKRMH